MNLTRRLHSIAAKASRSRGAWHRSRAGGRLIQGLLDLLEQVVQYVPADAHEAELMRRAVEASTGEFAVRLRSLGLPVGGARDCDPTAFELRFEKSLWNSFAKREVNHASA